MKVNELLMNIRNKEFNLERGLEVKKYLPMEVKKTIAQGIIYDCTSDENGAIKVDSVERYMSYVRYMITMHTNLAYTDDDYDVMCSTEYEDTSLLNAVMECFDADARECSRVLDLMMNDFMQDMNIEFTVSKFLNGLNEYVERIVGKLNDKIAEVDINSFIPDDVDRDKLKNFLNNYIK